jgi:DNA-binding PadR family transcriptional regulator
MLSLRPMSGYDIRKTVQESIRFFWSESYGQIYPALKRLGGYKECESVWLSRTGRDCNRLRLQTQRHIQGGVGDLGPPVT